MGVGQEKNHQLPGINSSVRGCGGYRVRRNISRCSSPGPTRQGLLLDHAPRKVLLRVLMPHFQGDNKLFSKSDPCQTDIMRYCSFKILESRPQIPPSEQPLVEKRYI